MLKLLPKDKEPHGFGTELKVEPKKRRKTSVRSIQPKGSSKEKKSSGGN